MIELEKEKEKVILVGVEVDEDITSSLDELADLADTAGAVEVSRLIQKRERQHPVTYLGKGKVEELRFLIEECEATGVICDDELSPVQMKNLQNALDEMLEQKSVKVMDRTLVILDIFAGRASTNEGKIQVELAQLKYRQSRLTGFGVSMSRLGGGIGTRGPGEKKLEMDRRIIKERIAQLNRELKEVKRHREVTRESRSKSRIPVISIVGYTNAGKSTLLNHLTGADILAEDKLFATLDATTRNLKLPSGQEILMTDTVGFIRKLPHHLIDAFRSTLEEAKYADIILHVADASNEEVDIQMATVYDTLRDLGIEDKSIITAFNKIDLENEIEGIRDFKSSKTVFISAKKEEGFGELFVAIEEILREKKKYIEGIYSYQDAGKIQIIRKYGELLLEKYEDEGIYVKAYVPTEVYERVKISI